MVGEKKTRPNTRLPKSRAGGQSDSDKNGKQSIWAGAVMRQPLINAEKANCDGPTNGPTDRRTDAHSGI